MRYLVFFLSGIVLFFLGILSLRELAEMPVNYGNMYMLFHWLVFGLVTASVPKMAGFIINTDVPRFITLTIGSGYFITGLLTYVLWYEVSRSGHEINFLYINIFYFIGILLTLSFIKRFRS
jgi:hypothetical protein